MSSLWSRHNAKIEEGFFAGLQIRCLINDEEFEETMVVIESETWLAFKNNSHYCLRNRKLPDNGNIVVIFLNNY